MEFDWRKFAEGASSSYAKSAGATGAGAVAITGSLYDTWKKKKKKASDQPTGRPANIPAEYDSMPYDGSNEDEY